MKNQRILALFFGCLLILSTSFLSDATPYKEEIARKLIKLFLAAALLSPPGVGFMPLPLPLPVPFAIEALKPPIIHPPFLHPPFFHGGFHGGGLHGGGFGFGRR